MDEPERIRTPGSSSNERSYATTSKPRVVPSTDAGGGPEIPRESAASAAARASACLARPSSCSRTRRCAVLRAGAAGAGLPGGGAEDEGERKRREGAAARGSPADSTVRSRPQSAAPRASPRAMRSPIAMPSRQPPVRTRPGRNSRSFSTAASVRWWKSGICGIAAGHRKIHERVGAVRPGWRRFASSVATARTSASGAAASAGSSAPPRNDVVRIEPAGARPVEERRRVEDAERPDALAARDERAEALRRAGAVRPRERDDRDGRRLHRGEPRARARQPVAEEARESWAVERRDENVRVPRTSGRPRGARPRRAGARAGPRRVAAGEFVSTRHAPRERRRC